MDHRLLLGYRLHRIRNLLLPNRVLAAYNKFLRKFGGHGFGRFQFVRTIDSLLQATFRPRVAETLGHRMFIDSADSLNLSSRGWH